MTILIVGVALAVVAFVRADLVADLVVLLALGLVSVTSARLALGRESTWRVIRAVGPATHPGAFLNARSGGGKVVKFGLVEAAGGRGAETVMIEPGLDLKAAAEAAVSDGADVLVAAGGDGTQAVIAQAASRRGIAFLCIPAGTYNNFGGDLGLDLSDPSTALAALDEADEVAVDLGRVNGRVFVNNVSLGLYPEIISDRAPAARPAGDPIEAAHRPRDPFVLSSAWSEVGAGAGQPSRRRHDDALTARASRHRPR